MEFIQSKDNPKVKEYVKLLSGKQARRKLGKFTLEGTRLCVEALQSDISVESVFVTENFVAVNPTIVEIVERKEIPIYQISSQVDQRISETVGPQGIYMVCLSIPELNLEKLCQCKKILCLYDIQDPGNMGTMVRSADAFGFEALVLSAGCCDLFSPKVLRAAMGSVFHLPYMIVEDMNLFEESMSKVGMVSAAAVVRGGDLEAGYCNLPEIHLLYIGNEGKGLPRDFALACRYRITLPMKGKAESLNAAMAAGILMWELMK